MGLGDVVSPVKNRSWVADGVSLNFGVERLKALEQIVSKNCSDFRLNGWRETEANSTGCQTRMDLSVRVESYASAAPSKVSHSRVSFIELRIREEFQCSLKSRLFL